ncbi:acrosin [Bombina bombina]|uniref:acrosin n=1 Tax=Bombina bombina TaxID=8345 RepID=UPI00235A9707|nr:acrosin [Bombina bombina]
MDQQLVLQILLVVLWASDSREQFNVHFLPFKQVTALPAVCGNRPLANDNRFGSRVVGGHDALPGSWPWIVSLQDPYGNTYGHLCGGTIINQEWVLTVAHCFKNQGNKIYGWRMVFGAQILSRLGPETQIRKITKLIIHEAFNPVTMLNDIALLKADKPIKFNNYTQAACLPPVSININSMTDCYIAGWGVTSEDSYEAADILQEAQVDLIPTKRCNSTMWYNGAVYFSNLCAGYEEGGIDACQGDSGGPLMCRPKIGSPFTVVGVTSWGSGCAQAQSPGIYTATQYFRNWIIQKLSNKGI